MPKDKKSDIIENSKKTDSKPIDKKKDEVKEVKAKDVKEPVKDKEPIKKTTPAKKVIEEVIVDDSDNESDDSELESGSEEEQEADEDKKQKEKKAKKSFQELSDEFETLSAAIKVKKGEVNEGYKALKSKEKDMYDLERQQAKIYTLMAKAHDEEVKKAQKEKPKRKGNKDGGFNKETPVPPKLIKFLGLEDDIKMSRPKVMSAMNDKFKDLKIKEGQTTTLDAATAKALGKEKGRVIEFTAFQSFLKEFYSEAFPEGATNTVAL
jgi:hypothetical protein